MYVEISREYKFDAAHHLPHVPAGHKCGHVHGHTYSMTVTVRGPVDPAMGWVMDFGDLDAAVKPLVNNWDHSDLNMVMHNPTAELLALAAAKIIGGALPGHVRLVSVTLSEGGRNSVCVRL